MNVTVRTILTFRDILGSRELELFTPAGTTVMDLLQELMRRYGPPLRQVLWDARTESPATYVRILVNGQDICFIEGLGTRLDEGDELLLLPPVAGG